MQIQFRGEEAPLIGLALIGLIRRRLTSVKILPHALSVQIKYIFPLPPPPRFYGRANILNGKEEKLVGGGGKRRVKFQAKMA